MSKIEAREIAEELEQVQTEKRKVEDKKENREMCFSIGIFLLAGGFMMLFVGVLLLEEVPGDLGSTLTEAFNLGLNNGAWGIVVLILGALFTIGGIVLLRLDFQIQIQDAVKKALDEYAEAEED